MCSNFQDYLVIHKITHNQPITKDELDQLEFFIFDGQERGTRYDFEKALGTPQPLGAFIRSILGLDRQAALEAFCEFLSKGDLSASQQKFIELIIDHFEHNGIIQPEQLYEYPYTMVHLSGLDGVFDDERSGRIVRIIREVNAGVGA